MKNFVFLSPNFPEDYWKFCQELRNNGLRVLGIGDCPYDELLPQLKEALHEYYKVSNLENYEEVYRAIGYFIHKYGRIDWLESNTPIPRKICPRVRWASPISTKLPHPGQYLPKANP